MRLSSHALERFELHHPEVTRQDLINYISVGEVISQGLATALTGRKCAREMTDRYVVSPDGKGMFVIQNNTVITYLRFQRSQQVFCQEQGLSFKSPGTPPPPTPVEPPILSTVDLGTFALPVKGIIVSPALRSALGVGSNKARKMLPGLLSTMEMSSRSDPKTWAAYWLFTQPGLTIRLESIHHRWHLDIVE